MEIETLDADSIDWYQVSCDKRCTHYLFLSQPESILCRPVSRRTSEEYTHFRNCSITKAVLVVDNVSVPPKKKGDVLAERFLKLERQGHSIEWLATAALVMFSLPRPSPFPNDGVYWSEEPKLVTLWKKTPDASLGFSIMTRQMGSGSVFDKVILVKKFSEKSNEGLIGKFGHIQCINGELLDGLSIDEATSIFKGAQQTSVQLIVRFIHPLKLEGNTPSPTCAHRPDSLYLEIEETTPHHAPPIPLFIFGDNPTVCSSLADFLSMSKEGLASSPSLKNLTTPSSVSSTSYLLSQQNSPRGSSEDVDQVLGDQVSWHSFSSDEYIDRQEASHNYFDKLDHEQCDAGTPRQQPVSTSVSDFRFVVQTLKDASGTRPFAHLFMKSVGLYLVALDLEDVAFDPLIQYENMLFWLNLIHMYLRTSTLERVFIVGMCKRSELEEHVKSKIVQCVELFKIALVKSGSLSQIFQFFEFDQDNPQQSTKELCIHVSHCLGILIERAPVFEAEFSKVMFQPSPHYHSVCTKLMSSSKQRPFVLDLNSFINSSCSQSQHMHLIRTLAAYAPIWIDDDNKACLVCPRLIVELMKSLMVVEHAARVYKDEFTFRYHLPILNYPFVKKKIEAQGLKNEAEQLKLLACMKRFHFLFSIGPSTDPNKQRFLVPYLASEECVEHAKFQQWDPQYVWKNFGTPSCITLYAELRFPATLQFFHSLLAVLLAQLLNHPPAGRDYHYFIKLGCKQAVLYLNYENEEKEVFLKYHPIQNVVEFRLPASGKTREQWLLKGVNNCLMSAYTSILPAPEDGNFPIVYCIPIPLSSQEPPGEALLPLQRLKELSSDGTSTPDDDTADDLLQYKYLDVKVSRSALFSTIFKSNPTLRTWASSDPEAKVLPADLNEELSKELSSSDAWRKLGVELGVLDTKDINLWTHNPHKYGNGCIVMGKWKDSDCTWQQLVAALNKIGHQRLATKVSKCMKE